MKPDLDPSDLNGTLRPERSAASQAPSSQIQKPTTRAAPFSLVPSTIPGSELLLLEAAPPPPQPGGRIGRYSITSVLGHGAMGMVLRAKDDILQRDVALKVILPEYLAREPAAGLNFLREGEIVASLDHPHIVRVLDAGFDAGVAFLAFNFIEGPSFSSLAQGEQRSLAACAELLLPIADALDYAHQCGVVHGDLKPTNLFLGRNYRGEPHPIILDFGTSFIRGEDERTYSTRARVGGTVGYQAPEWLMGRDIDHRADLFSLGCILYELLVGTGPFHGVKRLSEASERAQRGTFTPPSQLTDHNKAVDELITLALAPDAKMRIESAREFGNRLAALAESARF